MGELSRFNEMILPVNAMYIGDFKIIVEFNNGELRIADFKYLLEKELPDFPEIKEEEYFKKFQIDIMGGLCWDNDFDIAPDYLYDISKPAIIKAAS